MGAQTDEPKYGVATVDWVGQARALRDMIEDASPSGEINRELAPAVVEALHESGLFRLLIPRELEGGQVDLVTFMETIEALAQADGSAAWCVAQVSGCSLTSAYLPRDAAWEMFGANPRAVLAWGAGPSGRAERRHGGWSVTGNWSYASGLRHANWLGGQCPMFEADGAPLFDPDGSPMVRTFVFPKTQAQVIDDWHTMGLRATGSDSYSVRDIFVRDAFCFLRSVASTHPGTLYRVPLSQVYPLAFGGVALGIAGSVMDAFITTARGKTPRGGHRMRDNAAIQSIIGHATARLRSARMFLLHSIRDIWADLEAGYTLSEAQSLTIRMASTFAIQEALAVVDIAYHEVGATAIHVDNPFERRFRDIHAVAQQVQGRRANFELIGRAMLGLPTGPLFL
jgi:alkylation response protein AidB-like acyl-CoA dehydrogenase